MLYLTVIVRDISMNYKIVAIDDDKKVVVFIKRELEKLGNTVFTTDDGKKGLDLIKEIKPDLLICDMLIPGIHGSELSKTLKNDSEFKSLKIILMTGVYKKINWLLEMKSWTDGFIEKPFEMSKLINIIDKIME
jgi:two-component system alkaline phosphatase synthesis response regulator PhoP